MNVADHETFFTFIYNKLLLFDTEESILNNFIHPINRTERAISESEMDTSSEWS